MNPTESSSVPIASCLDPVDAGKSSLPYWHYMSSKNEKCPGECVFDSKKPSLYKSGGNPSVEGALERSATKHLLTCLQEFQPLEKEGFTVTPKGNPSFVVTLSGTGVRGVLTYDIDSKKGEKVSNLKTFYGAVPVAIVDAYKTASAITESEQSTNYFERASWETLQRFFDVDAAMLPPDSDLAYGFDPVFWPVTDIQDKVANDVIPSTVQLSQAYPSTNYNAPQSPIPLSKNQEGLFFVTYARDYRMSLADPALRNVIPPSMKLFDIDFESVDGFGSFSSYVSVDCKGVCTSEPLTLAGMMPVGIQRYETRYDYSFPVIVSVKDPDAFNGKGFTFSFALESNVRSNSPVEMSSPPGAIVEVPGISDLFSDKKQWTSGDVVITLTDTSSSSGGSDGGALVSFECPGVSVSLGSVSGSLTTKLPRCIDGVLSAKKQGYYSSVVRLSTFTTDVQVANIVISPLTNVSINVDKVLVRKDSDGSKWSLLPDKVEGVSRDEQVLVTLEKVTARGEEPLTAMIDYPTGDISSAPRWRNNGVVQLVPGKYKTEVYIIKRPKDAITILPQKRCYGPSDMWDSVTGEDCGEWRMVPETAQTFRYVVSNDADKKDLDDKVKNKETIACGQGGGAGKSYCGSLLLGKASFNVTLSVGDLSASSKKTFLNLKIPYLDLGQACKVKNCVIEDLGEASSIGEYVDLYPEVFAYTVVRSW